MQEMESIFYATTVHDISLLGYGSGKPVENRLN